MNDWFTLQKLYIEQNLPTRGQVLQAGGQVLRAGGIVIALAALVVLLVVLVRLGYAYPWTGFDQSEVNQAVQPAKTLWDWLGLLVVPLVLAIGGYLFNSSQNRATQEATNQRAQEDAFQAYLDNMSDILVPNKDQPSLYEESSPSAPDTLSSVVRARTLTVLRRLDGDGKARVVQFLYEAHLIGSRLPVRIPSIVNLTGADLRGADLRDASLGGADLGGTDLRGAYLREAYLQDSNLSAADLREADLRGAYLGGTYLGGAHLRGAQLRGIISADLTGPNLRGVDLRGVSGANLKGTSLSGVSLRGLVGADLRGASLRAAKGVTKNVLLSATSLEGATMPDGQILKSHDNPHGPTLDEWLKSKGRGEDGENSGPS